MGRVATVAVPVPGVDRLDYAVPDGLVPVRGARVVVPLGHRLVTGLVLGVGDTAASATPGRVLRNLDHVLDAGPFLSADVMALALWVADYYLCSPGEALAAAMPPLAWVESERRWVLTPAGVAARDSASRAEWRAVLARMDVENACTEAELLGLWPADPEESRADARGRLERVLRSLARAGLVSSVQHLTGRADASRTARFVHLEAAATDEAALAKVTRRQREAVDTLSDLLLLRPQVSAASLEAEGVTPAVLNALERKGLVRFERTRVERVSEESFGSVPEDRALGDEVVEITPTDEQRDALGQLSAWAAARTFRVALLHGVTGSGKTEVYRRLARLVAASGRGVLILVPEIALTPAVAGRFRATFRDRVAIQHSALSDGERHDQWQRIRRGEVDVVVGTRSAVFAPLRDVGLIVVDEEHDTSYKQEEPPRYHGRDVAIVRGQKAGALVVLGSATPSLESYHNAQQGRYALVTLRRRVLDRPLAEVTTVNMREEFAEAGPDVVLSAALTQAIRDRLDQREQAIILLNRRGFASNVFCRQCGDTLECPNCSVALTVHRRANRARCHYCDYSRSLPDTCVKCDGAYLEYQGIGTERVEADLRERFERARVERVDRDTVRRRGEITRVLRRFARREIDVLVGTQMIAKGHDFPAVTLVGVVSADVGLGLADFRAAERTFQLLTQVAGRAGRGDRPGQAIIQTLFPDHYSIRLAEQQDFVAFYDRELQYRRSMHYPPALALVNIVVRARTEDAAWQGASRVADRLRAARGPFRVLGPAHAPLSRLRGQYRVQLFLKGTARAAMRQAVRDALRAHPDLTRSISVDVDPLSML